jgi:hypothetical protein
MRKGEGYSPRLQLREISREPAEDVSPVRALE